MNAPNAGQMPPPNAAVAGTKAADIPRVIPNQSTREGAHAPLPAPGYSREEELKRRNDELAEQLQALTNQLRERGIIDDGAEKGAVDLQQVVIDNEIASKFDLLRVPNALPEFDYRWVNFSTQFGLMVTTAKVEGFEVVHSSMPEAKGMNIDAMGRCTIGDVLLMRIPADINLERRRHERMLRRLQQEGIEAAFEELGARTAGAGIVTHGQIPDRFLKGLFMHKQAQQIAGQRFNSMLRGGSVPGMRMG